MASRVPNPPAMITVESDATLEVTQVIVGNTRRYAAAAEVTPEAMVDDGRLDVVLLTPV